MGKQSLKLQDEILVVDLETTCWEKEPPPGEVSDILEIGVAHLRIQDLTLINSWNVYAIPTRSKITPYCTEINGITDEIIAEKGVTLSAAFRHLELVKSRARTWASWGNFDRKKMEDDCKSPLLNAVAELPINGGHMLRYPMSPRHINVKTLFTVMHNLDREPSMDKALSILGWELKGRHHSGKDDAYNIARILGHLIGDFRFAQSVHDRDPRED